jgi:transposase
LENAGELPVQKHKIERVDMDTGEVKETSLIHVFKPENIGDKMCIDDKCIGHNGYTIFSNQKTNKIALMLESTKFDDIEQAFKKFNSENLHKVKSICSDMDAVYLKVGEEILPHATKVVDKYHVIKYVYDALLDVLSDEKKQLKEQLSDGKEKTENDYIILDKLAVLKRCRHMLLQSIEKWSDRTKEIMKNTFEISEVLETAYFLVQSFKKWYGYDDNASVDIILKDGNLQQWYKKVKTAGLKQFNQVVKMIKKHEKNILNYFKQKHTNANAEQLNNKIQRFISNNFGIKNKNFFMFRLANYFS